MLCRVSFLHIHIHPTHPTPLPPPPPFQHSMLLFGGIGAQMIFGDVHSCRVADPDTYYATGPAALTAYNLESVAEGSARRRKRRVVWEAVELVGGEVPEAR